MKTFNKLITMVVVVVATGLVGCCIVAATAASTTDEAATMRIVKRYVVREKEHKMMRCTRIVVINEKNTMADLFNFS